LIVAVGNPAPPLKGELDPADPKFRLHPTSLRYDMPVATANRLTQAARVTVRRVEIDHLLLRDVTALVPPETQ